MRAILFDLDGTLLDIETDRFMERYFAALRAVRVPGHDGSVFKAVWVATEAMMDRHPGVTNEDAFWARFLEMSGGSRDDFEPTFETFYRDVFPSLRGSAGPRAHAREAVTTALEAGFAVAVATNPLFPRVAIEHRIGWAGLADLLDRVHVTTYENATATKPLPAYFEETAAALGARPDECLMVGDDAELDLPAAKTGMRTFYVGPDPMAPAGDRGDLGDLVEMLGRL